MNGRAQSLVVTLLLHAAAAWALLQLDAVRKPLLEAVPLMVTLIAPALPEPPPAPAVAPPKPLPVARQAIPRKPAELRPLLAVETAASIPSAAASPPPPKFEAAATAAPVEAPPRLVPPSFDAAYLRNPPPVYPLWSRRRGEQGRAVLRVHVTAQGVADEVHLRNSSGHDRLDQAALEAVRQWRFVPARQGDRPVAAWVLVPILFSLEN